MTEYSDHSSTHRIFSACQRYMVRHWRGQQSLTWSFWINLVLLRLLVFLLQSAWVVPNGELRGMPALLVAAAIALLHGLLFVWQAVGVVRAAETYVLSFGSRTNALGSQLGIVVLFLLTLVYSLEAYQTTLDPPAEFITERMAREREASYTLALVENGHEARLKGPIALGATRRLRAFLDSHPDIDGIVLESAGGNVYEGRGLANLLFERGMNTRVEALCASACTLAFIGGTRRTLGDKARFGLHAYRLESSHAILVTDPESEQERDRALFLRAGVAPWFVRQMFDADADQMWWPRVEVLLRAGVIKEGLR